MKKSLLAILAIMLTQSACINMAPRRKNAFRPLNLTTVEYKYPPYVEPTIDNPTYDKNTSFRNLTLAMVETQNYKTSRDFSRRSEQFANWDTKKMYADMNASVAKYFKTVIKVNSLEEARATKADLFAITDVVNKLRAPVMAKLTIDWGIFFLDRDSKLIDVVHAIEARRFKMSEFGGGSGVGGKNVVQRTAADAARKIQIAIQSSEKLRDFSAARGGKATQRRKRIVSDVDKPKYKSRKKPNFYALVIGVEKYQNAGTAQFAVRDAKAVREHLLALGCPQENLVYLTGRKASRSAIEKYIETWLPKNVKPGSTVFVYFAGRGAPDAKTKAAHILPWDGDPKFLRTTGYPLKRIYERLGRLKAKSVVFAVDAGFSGTGERSVLAKGTQPGQIKFPQVKTANLAVLTAASTDEEAGVFENKGHGMFTYALLKGLSGKAKAGGKVTVKSLFAYVRKSVLDAAGGQSRDQTPQLNGGKTKTVLR